MSYETVKAYILAILIGISILLSVALWTYQPNYEQFQDPDYVSEVDIGGKEKNKNNLIGPSSIIVHNETGLYGFNTKAKKSKFYEDISTWVMYDYEERGAKGRPKDEVFFEIIYPLAIPAAALPSLFTFNSEVDVPNWTFERIYVTLNPENYSFNVIFRSSDGKKEIVAVVEKKEKYDLLIEYLTVNDDLIEYTEYGSKENPVFLPKEEITLDAKTLIVSRIKPEKLVNALFRNPSRVTPNVAEAYFTDGQRGMNVSEDNNRIEFINPIQTTSERLESIYLLERSIENINEHKGWTNDYLLDSIDRTNNRAQFRLMFEGIPVFERSNLTLISQEWRENELYQYTRPLIKLTNEVNSSSKVLPSGIKLMNHIEEKKLFDKDKIENIQVGYELNFLPNASDSIRLTPTWYVKYQGKWEMVKINSLNKEKGGE